jgi:signal peptide peptidase SppA
MKRHLLLAELAATPWALPLAHFEAYRTVLLRWAGGEAASPAVGLKVEADKDVRTARRAAAGKLSSGRGIAVLPMYGVISQRMSMADDLSGPGSMSTQRFSAALREALDDKDVGSIIIDIDSPGGAVYGVSELGDEINAARSQKPITAIANSLCASAAYWLGSQCDELYCTPGGEVGSIGVLAAHADFSKQNEMLGVNVTYVTAGKFKAEMNPDQPLSAEAKEYEQSRVNDYYAMFTKAVSRGRRVPIADVRDKMGQGRVLGAKDALAAKMIDGVATFDEVVARAQSPRPPGSTGAAARATLLQASRDEADARIQASMERHPVRK